MEKIVKFFKENPVGKIVLQLLIIVIDLIPGGGTVGRKLGSLAEEVGAKQIKNPVALLIFVVTIGYLLAAYFGLVDGEILHSISEVIEAGQVLVPDSLNLDTAGVVLDTIQ